MNVPRWLVVAVPLVGVATHLALAQSNPNCSPLMPVCFAADAPAVANEVNLNFKRAADFSVPAGGIIMWSGTTVPPGWSLCDGSNGTPDLRGRFIVSSGAGYAVNATGGANSVTLTVAQLPSHNHGISSDGFHTHEVWVDTGGGGFAGGNFPTTGWGSNVLANERAGTTGAGSHSHGGATQSTGSAQSIENRPAYYALAFIMKLP